MNIDVMDAGLRRIRRHVAATRTPGVLGGPGSFGGLYKSPGKDSVLVSSTDGVGTKLAVAHKARQHRTIGQDLVNHCVNDILVQGARPLFFLDYLGMSTLKPDIFAEVVAGICKACKANDCALLGGEAAEMPGLYPPGEYDLVGTIVGAVERKKLVTGSGIREGDVLIGLPSSGLHTNGYTLARKIVFESARLTLRSIMPGTRSKVGPLLLKVHRSYLKPIQRLMQRVQVHGMAHITGGGLADNVPRILPGNVSAEIDRSAWRVPALFTFLETAGRVGHDEMYRVFNMGIGYVVIVRKRDCTRALDVLRKAAERPKVIGRITRGEGRVTFLN